MEYNVWIITAVLAIILFIAAIIGWLYTRNLSKIPSWVWLLFFLAIIMSIAALSVYMHNHHHEQILLLN